MEIYELELDKVSKSIKEFWDMALGSFRRPAIELLEDMMRLEGGQSFVWVI